MKVKMLSTSNKVLEELIGKEMELRIDTIASYTFDPKGCSFDFRRGNCTTSQIKSIVYDEVSMGCTNIIIKTRNSEYIFQHGEPSNKKPLTDEEILNYQLALGMYLF